MVRCPRLASQAVASSTLKTLAHRFHARGDIQPSFVRGKVERETGFEPATFCLGTPALLPRKVRKP
jgi:hypothetical protein